MRYKQCIFDIIVYDSHSNFSFILILFKESLEPMDKSDSIEKLDCIEYDKGSALPSDGPMTTAEVFMNLKIRSFAGDILLERWKRVCNEMSCQIS